MQRITEENVRNIANNLLDEIKRTNPDHSWSMSFSWPSDGYYGRINILRNGHHHVSYAGKRKADMHYTLSVAYNTMMVFASRQIPAPTATGMEGK